MLKMRLKFTLLILLTFAAMSSSSTQDAKGVKKVLAFGGNGFIGKSKLAILQKILESNIPTLSPPRIRSSHQVIRRPQPTLLRNPCLSWELVFRLSIPNQAKTPQVNNL